MLCVCVCIRNEWSVGSFAVCVQISIVEHFHLIQILNGRGSWSMVCPFIFCLSACLSVVEIRNTVESTKCRRYGKSMENNASKCPVYYLYYYFTIEWRGTQAKTGGIERMMKKKYEETRFGNVLENVRECCF